MPTRRFACLGLGALALCGCQGGAVTPVTRAPDEAVARAQAEIGDIPPPLRRQLADGELTATLRRVSARVEPPAWDLCRDLGVASCDWYVRGSRSRQMNAHAGADGRVVINRGIVEYARTEEETAFVVAHELAHHVANHVRGAAEDAETGAAIGSLLAGVLMVAAAAGGGRTTPGSARRTVENYGHIGARLSQITYSRDQEREADRLAVLLLHRAGYDPAQARGMLVTLGRATRRRVPGIFDTHPGGPERLANFDATLAELRAGGGTIRLREG